MQLLSTTSRPHQQLSQLKVSDFFVKKHGTEVEKGKIMALSSEGIYTEKTEFMYTLLYKRIFRR